jgi:hypothetical protein
VPEAAAVGGGSATYVNTLSEQYKVVYDAMRVNGGIYPSNLCMDGPPLTEEQQLELVKNQVNKRVSLGIYTAPPGWEPYTVSQEVAERIAEAYKRSGRSQDGRKKT